MKKLSLICVVAAILLLCACMGEGNLAKEFVVGYGWQISSAPIEIENVKIPTEFDTVHEEYNRIQKSAGFDLENYKGKVLKRYSYEVLNHPSGMDSVRVNVFVYEGKIVAADVMSVEIGGFMHAINENNPTGE